MGLEGSWGGKLDVVGGIILWVHIWVFWGGALSVVFC